MFSTHGVLTDTPAITCDYTDWLEILNEWAGFWARPVLVVGSTVRSPSLAVLQRALQTRPLVDGRELTDRFAREEGFWVDPTAPPHPFTDEAWDNLTQGPEPWQ